jgi:hypothetical protein
MIKQTLFAFDIAIFSVCGIAAAATAWLGTASGLFAILSPSGISSLFEPYVALALLAWFQRRRPIPLRVLLVLSILVSAFGLFFLFNDWYWPEPTNPNPWRVVILLVITGPQWLVIGVTALVLLGCHLHRRWHGAASAKPAGLQLSEL